MPVKTERNFVHRHAVMHKIIGGVQRFFISTNDPSIDLTVQDSDQVYRASRWGAISFGYEAERRPH